MTTPLVQADPVTKRVRLHYQEPQSLHMQSSPTASDMQSFSGSFPSGVPTYPELHWTASDGSTSNSVSQQPVMMEEDQQSALPAPQHLQQTLGRSHGMSHSSSAPDLRLLLTTQLPDTRPMFLPDLGSYAGAMVPYKGPEGDMLY